MKNTLKILYVEDEKINRFIFEKLMGKKYQIITAKNSPDGIEILEKEHDIDFIVIDMRMPIMNGIEFIREVHKKHQDLRCFILTDYSINQEIQEAIDEGLILCYWSKPADFDMIDKTLQQYA